MAISDFSGPNNDMQAVDLSSERGKRAVAANLARNESNVPYPTLDNILTIFRHDPALQGISQLNEFNQTAFLMRHPPAIEHAAHNLPGPYPRQWTDVDKSFILAYIQRKWISKATIGQIDAAVHAMAAIERFHPIRDWLGSLKWDGVRRIDTWLQNAFGTEDTPYTRDVGIKTLVASVRRIFHPGCKFDHMPILEGLQGIGKSRAIRVLYGEAYFSDSITHDLSSKDAAINLRGVWAVEMAEIGQLRRNEVEVIKAYITRQVDKFRAPYDREDTIRPRQNIFWGTTNASTYLQDATGNRRFWPISCTRSNVAWIIENRDQLWAEAVAVEDAGEPLWLENEDSAAIAHEVQITRVDDEDVWDSKVAEYVSNKETVAISDFLETKLSIFPGQQDKRHQMRVAAILKRLGWERKTMRMNGAVTKTWVKKDAVTT